MPSACGPVAVPLHHDRIVDLPDAISSRNARRAVTRPTPTRLIALVVAVVRAFLADDGLTWAAGMAFYLVLSIPPLLIGVAALTQLATGRHDLVAGLLDHVTRVIPGVGDTVERLAAGRGEDVAVTGVLALGWILVSGSRVFGVLASSLSAMWGIPKKGTLIRRELLRVALLLGGLVVLVLGALVASIVGDVRQDGSPAGFVVWLTGTQIVPLVLVAAALTGLYRLIPRGRAAWGAALAGAIVGTVLLRVVELAFVELFSASTGWQTVYGPLAGVALLMTWAFAASASVVAGAEVAIALQHSDRLDGDGRGAPGEENHSPQD